MSPAVRPADGIAAVARRHALVRQALSDLARQPLEARSTVALQRAVAAEQELERQLVAPVSVAFVGGYSTGKSRLIGSLLGDAHLLPSGHAPLTGNITALKLVRGRPGTRARVHGYAVRFLGRDQVRRYLHHLLTRLVEIAGSTTVAELPPPAQITAVDPFDGGWEPLVGWLRALPWQQGAHLHTLLSAAHDVALLRIALAEGEGFLGPGAVASSPVPLADGRLLADAVARASQSLPDRMPDPVPGSRILPGQRLGPDELRRLFPLIAQVEIDVEVDPQILGDADLESLELLDFAGIDASASLRDRYLTETEIGRPVHVVVQAVNALRPQARENDEIQHLLQRAGLTARQIRDMLLVVVTLADALPGTGATGADPFTPGQALAAVRQGVGDLLGRDSDRFTLHSADLCCLRGRVPLPPGTEGQQVQDRARQNAGAVDQLARALPADRIDTWSDAVRELARDGGLARTRRLVFGHLAGYGLGQKHTAVCRAQQTLADTVRELVATVQPADNTNGPAIALLREVKVTAAAQVTALDQLLLSPPPDCSEVEDVYALSVWQNVLDRLQRTVHVTTPRVPAAHAPQIPGWDDFAPASTGPQDLTAADPFAPSVQIPVDDTTDGLHHWFVTVAKGRLQIVEQDFLELVRRQAPDLESGLVTMGRRVQADRVGLLVAMLRPLTDKAHHLPRLLDHLTTPGRLLTLAEQTVRDVGPHARDDLTHRFPMPLNRVLPWSPARPSTVQRSPLRDYQSLVRFRHQIAQALASLLQRHRQALLVAFVQRSVGAPLLLSQIPDIPPWATIRAATTGTPVGAPVPGHADSPALERLRDALATWSEGTGCGG
jgi:hypothetical protein